MNIREAAREWVKGFSAIPVSVIAKLDDYTEITPYRTGDYVCVFGNGQSENGNGEGRIVGYVYDEDGERDPEMFIVEVEGERFELSDGVFERIYNNSLPMWETMWAFVEKPDIDWIDRGGLEAMIDCGFRIYEQEDFDYIFGIDGAGIDVTGYDFYAEHWIPLYKARGLRYRDDDEEPQMT